MRVLVAGDYCPQHRLAKIIDSGRYDEVLGGVKEIIKDDEYKILNFECPVADEGDEPIKKHGPNLCCNDNGVEAIKSAGFECVTLANNHFFDFGKSGVEKTLGACKKRGLDTVGGVCFCLKHQKFYSNKYVVKTWQLLTVASMSLA